VRLDHLLQKVLMYSDVRKLSPVQRDNLTQPLRIIVGEYPDLMVPACACNSSIAAHSSG